MGRLECGPSYQLRTSGPIHFNVAAMIVGTVLSFGCFSDGLDERAARARFQERRVEFEALLSMVEDDADAFDLRFVSADAADQSAGTLWRLLCQITRLKPDQCRTDAWSMCPRPYRSRRSSRRQ
jgi:hypothetical protein